MSVENTGLSVLEPEDLDDLLRVLHSDLDPAVNAVRIGADGLDWDELRGHGLTVRPNWIQWAAPVGGGADDLIGRQSSHNRQRTRRAVRAMEGLSLEVHEPVPASVFDEWLTLYSSQVAGMRYGLNMAAQYRDSVLADDSQHAMLVWRDANGAVACGIVLRFDPEQDAVVARFGAAGDGGHERTRAMYAALADLTAARGLHWLSLGNDINFYGTVMRPGLCAFKLRLGFAPVPADLFGNRSTRTVAEVVTGLQGVEAPLLRFEYLGARSDDAVLDDFVDGPAGLGLVSVTAQGATGDVLDALPQHRSIVIP